MRRLILLAASGAVVTVCSATAEPLRVDEDGLLSYGIVGDSIPDPLGGLTGDPLRGREIAAGREGNCLACHRMPIPEEQFHGDVGPPLDGVGDRLLPGQIRLRLVDPKRLGAQSIMPAFYVVERLQRVAAAYRGRPILEAQQIEDLVAYLATLGDDGDGTQ